MADEEKPNALAAHERIIRPKKGIISIDFGELWRYRELFLFLAWRDILVRYKQTYLGIAWAVLQPFITMVVFTILFGKLMGQADKLGMPMEKYAVMSLAAIVAWQFFANAMRESSNSLVSNAQMISKIYFPRLIIPTSAVISGTVDFVIGLVILTGIMMFAGTVFSAKLLLLPLFLLVAFLGALGLGLWLSALNVKYRDVKYVIPFVTQLGFFASPIGFSTEIIPDEWLFWYNLYPMVGVIDGFRWCILGSAEPHWAGFGASMIVVAGVLFSGALFFRSSEKTFADVI